MVFSETRGMDMVCEKTIPKNGRRALVVPMQGKRGNTMNIHQAKRENPEPPSKL